MGKPTQVQEHLCSCVDPTCAECGRKWSYYVEYSDGQRTHTDAGTVARYHALYGDPIHPFVKMK